MWVLILYKNRTADGIKICSDIDAARQWVSCNIKGCSEVYKCGDSYYIKNRTDEIGMIIKAEVI